MPQVEWIDDEDDECLVDFVGRFEKLEEDFRRVCGHIGKSARLPHLKSSDRPDYRDIYSQRAAEVIGERFASDSERFGYEF